jgi:hypothetical protein
MFKKVLDNIRIVRKLFFINPKILIDEINLLITIGMCL